MKLAHLKLTPELLSQLLRLPPDVQVIGSKESVGEVTLCLSSDRFPPLVEGAVPFVVSLSDDPLTGGTQCR